MKSIVTLAAFLVLTQAAVAQGSGEPSAQGQTTSAKGEASADKAVQARHDKAVARSNARAAKHAKKAASAASQ